MQNGDKAFPQKILAKPNHHFAYLCLDSVIIYTEGKSLAIYFEDLQFRRNRTFNFIASKIYVDKRSRER